MEDGYCSHSSLPTSLKIIDLKIPRKYGRWKPKKMVWWLCSPTMEVVLRGFVYWLTCRSMFVALKPPKMGGINHSNLEVCQHSPSILSKHQDFHPQEVCLRCLKGRLTRCHLFGGHIHSPTPLPAPAWSPKRPVPASLAVSFLGCERLPRSHSPPIKRVISCGKWWVSSNQKLPTAKGFFWNSFDLEKPKGKWGHIIFTFNWCGKVCPCFAAWSFQAL